LGNNSVVFFPIEVFAISGNSGSWFFFPEEKNCPLLGKKEICRIFVIKLFANSGNSEKCCFFFRRKQMFWGLKGGGG
jgi:hypothetical protein